MELTKAQKNAVDNIVDYWKHKINKELVFKAPTGSGKTFMMAKMIDQMISLNEGNSKKLFFIIATPSSAELPRQFYNKLNDYKSYLDNKDLKIELVESPSSSNKKGDQSYHLEPEENKVMIFGKSSFGKKRIFTEQGVIDALFDEVRRMQYNQELSLIYIRDEAHIGTKVNKEYINNFENKISRVSDFTIKMSATTEMNQDFVEITEEELINADDVKLLKKNLIYNEGIIERTEVYDGETILRIACKKFKELKKEYDGAKNPGLNGVSPAMLIQVKNSDKNDEENQRIEVLVEKYKKIVEENGLTWATYFSEDKNTSSELREEATLKNLSANNSAYDVIFFKIGPATGWDIPRAAMLVQLRDVTSEKLNVQTIGRIKRNPNPRYPFNDDNIVFNYYIYSNNTFENIELVNWKLKNNFKEEKILFGQINLLNKVTKDVIDDLQYKEDVKALFENHPFESQFLELKEEFNKNQKLEGTVRYSKITQTQETAKLIEFWIEDSVELKIYVERQWELAKEYLKLFDYRYNFLENNLFEGDSDSPIKAIYLKLLDKFKDDLMFSWDTYRYLVIKNLLPKIKKAYKSHVKRFEEFGNFYNLDLANFNQIITFSKEKSDATKKTFPKFEKLSDMVQNKFVYESLNSKNEIKLLSKNEQKFIDDCRKFIDYIDKENTKINHFDWAINSPSGNIFFQYKIVNKNDEDESQMAVEVPKSFPDFITILNKEHLVFIEVKGQGSDDINLEKTNKLLSAYSEYVNSYKKLLSNENSFSRKKFKSLTMIVAAYSSDDSSYFELKGTSTIDSVNQKLQNQDQKRFTSLKSFFNEIAG
ncbi:DEAD/DEAH box helicase [Mycoplasmopsis synoviae]|uniref:DEAD/DEAH box helicase n=1 Tax=Mycoplasmopsis synoviae TaxID=2109 RepID=UPI003566F1EC